MSADTFRLISAIVIIVSLLLIIFFTIEARWRSLRAHKRSPEVRERYKTMILQYKPKKHNSKTTHTGTSIT
jgi:ABC-type nickel/cobalt efflux system permease component RcnA